MFFAAALLGHGPAPKEEFKLGEDAQRYRAMWGCLETLLGREPQWFTAEQKDDVRNAMGDLIVSHLFWDGVRPANEHVEIYARMISQMGWARAQRVLDSLPQVERISLRGESALTLAPRRWLAGRGTVVLRVDAAIPVSPQVPRSVVRNVDLSKGPAEPIALEPGTTWVFLLAEGASGGAVPVELRAGTSVARVRIPVEVPARGRLNVRIVDDGSGVATEAAVGLFAADGHPVCIDDAVFLYNTGPGDCGGRLRPYAQGHHWPADGEMVWASFVDGGFGAEAPEGEYTLIVAKGFEYIPHRITVRISANSAASHTVRLRRWTDMAAKGWISADGHVHYDRSSADVNARLLTWTRAEDVRISNIMHMGDSERTHFPQYAWGEQGRAREGDYWLVPGQEDPRTDEIGHTLHMNLKGPVRYADRYYLYHLVFEGVRKQGGLSGYAHVFQPDRIDFLVRRDMSLNVPHGVVDFTEVAEFGALNPRLYYEFLNLGFRLTATAGSDVPWGGSIGHSRMYGYTGGDPSPDAFFKAVREGRTFVSTGSLLEFTVNGARPGEEVQIKPGETVRVRAVATGYSVLPRFVELVAFGDVLQVATAPGPEARTVTLEADVRIDRNTWLIARTSGAFTSPVYVRVGPGRFWKKEAVPELVRIRLNDLREIELAATSARANAALKRDARALLERVRSSRALYQKLLGEARHAAAPLPR